MRAAPAAGGAIRFGSVELGRDARAGGVEDGTLVGVEVRADVVVGEGDGYLLDVAGRGFGVVGGKEREMCATP